MLKPKYTEYLHNLLNDSDSYEAIKKAMSSYELYEAQKNKVYAGIPTRDELNKKIIDFYRFYEIGFDSIGRFILELEIALNEIMPYYNGIFKSIDIMNDVEDIFGNVDMVETFEETHKGNTSGTSDNTSNTSANISSTTTSNVNNYEKDVNSQTPQGNIEKLNTQIDSVTHADNINWKHNTSNDSATNTGTDITSGTSTNKTSGTSETSVKHTSTRKGNQGVNTYAHDLLEFRGLIRNVEQEIINDKRIKELFMQVL